MPRRSGLASLSAFADFRPDSIGELNVAAPRRSKEFSPAPACNARCQRFSGSAVQRSIISP